MNNSNAAAKKRRAGIQPNTPPEPPGRSMSQSANSSAQNQAGLTLPQVIALIDRRLINLETFMNDTKQSDNSTGTGTGVSEDGTASATGIVMDSKEFNLFVDEINDRFQVLAQEINTLKDTVLKLQTYTLNVNKVLLTEITKNEDGVMPQISLEEGENVKFILESMANAETQEEKTGLPTNA